LTLNNNTVYGPRKVSISRLLDTVARNSSLPITTCEPLDLSQWNLPIPGSCSVCGIIDKLQIQGDDLQFCGKLQLNCSLLPIKREFPIPCLNITDCAIAGCRNNCNNHGTCSSVGVCLCSKGYYGPDCSIQLNGNCLQGPSSKSCWNVDAKDCKSISVSPASGGTGTTYNVNQSVIALTPKESCLAVTGVPCKMCVDAENVQVVGDKLQGCTVVRTECNGITFAKQSSDCGTLTTSKTLVCESDPAGLTKVLLISLVVVLAVGIIAVGSYFGYEKYKDSKDVLVFQRVPTEADEEDVAATTPLGSAVEEEEDSS